MTINNFQLISSLLSTIPHSPEDYIQVGIIPRSKDGNEVKKGGDDYDRVIRRFHFKDTGELLRSEQKIVDFCNTNNARAYIYPSFVDKKKVYHDLLRVMVEKVTRQDYSQSVDKLTSGLSSKNFTSKYLMFDVDTHDEDILRQVTDMIVKNGSHPTTIPTKNGYHVICAPFNYTKIVLPRDVEMKTKSLTLLYLPG